MYKRQHPEVFAAAADVPVEMNALETNQVDDERDVVALLRS